MAPSFIFWLSYHFLLGQNRKSHSSVFLCCKTKRKLLLCRLVFLWCIIDWKTSLHNRCYFLAFLGEQRSTAQSEQGVPDTHNTMVCQQAIIFLCLPHCGCLTLQARLVLAFACLKNAKKITPVMQAVGKQESLSGLPVTTDCLLYLPSAIFIPTFHPKKRAFSPDR